MLISLNANKLATGWTVICLSLTHQPLQFQTIYFLETNKREVAIFIKKERLIQLFPNNEIEMKTNR